MPLFSDVNAILGIQTISAIQTTNINDFGLYPQYSPIGQRSAKYYKDKTFIIDLTTLGISSLTVAQMDTYFQMYQDNISGNDVTYIQNEMTITDLTYIIGFGFIWFVVIWSIRKVVL